MLSFVEFALRRQLESLDADSRSDIAHSRCRALNTVGRRAEEIFGSSAQYSEWFYSTSACKWHRGEAFDSPSSSLTRTIRAILPTSWSVCLTPCMFGCRAIRVMRSESMLIPEQTPG